MDSNVWSVGDWMIYRKSKRSPSPGPRAQNITPASRGENYTYTVDKYWIVTEVLDDGHLLVETLGGKQHILSMDDSAVRRLRFWETLFLRNRFRKLEETLAQRVDSETGDSDAQS